MAKTVSQVQTQALSLLSAVGAGQTPSADDLAALDAQAAAAYLVSERVIDLVASVQNEAIDEAAFYPFAEFLAGLNGTSFGMPKAECLMLEERGRDGLRRVAFRAGVVAPLKIDAVQLYNRRVGWGL